MIEMQSPEPRVTALETAQNEAVQTLRWVVAKLGRVAAVQDEHTLRFERVEARLGNVEFRLGNVEKGLAEVRGEIVEVRADLAGLRRDLPGMMAEVMRDVLKDVNKS